MCGAQAIAFRGLFSCSGAIADDEKDRLPHSARHSYSWTHHWTLYDWAVRADPKYSGALPARHLILQPMLGIWRGSTARPASAASIAARRSAQVTGLPLPGRLSSNWPR